MTAFSGFSQQIHDLRLVPAAARQPVGPGMASTARARSRSTGPTRSAGSRTPGSAFRLQTLPDRSPLTTWSPVVGHPRPEHADARRNRLRVLVGGRRWPDHRARRQERLPGRDRRRGRGRQGHGLPPLRRPLPHGRPNASDTTTWRSRSKKPAQTRTPATPPICSSRGWRPTSTAPSAARASPWIG
jgi:hypothetical protein